MHACTKAERTKDFWYYASEVSLERSKCRILCIVVCWLITWIPRSRLVSLVSSLSFSLSLPFLFVLVLVNSTLGQLTVLVTNWIEKSIMSKTTSNPNVIKANELWGQWEKPTKDTVSSYTLSIKWVQPSNRVIPSHTIVEEEELMGSAQNVRQVKLAIYKEIIDFYHQETNDRMFKKRWEELHDSKLAEIGLEKRLESGIKGKDSANAYVLFPHLTHTSHHSHILIIVMTRCDGHRIRAG